MVGWRHQLNGHELEQPRGDNERQGRLPCCSPLGHKMSDTTEHLINMIFLKRFLSSSLLYCKNTVFNTYNVTQVPLFFSSRIHCLGLDDSYSWLVYKLLEDRKDIAFVSLCVPGVQSVLNTKIQINPSRFSPISFKSFSNQLWFHLCLMLHIYMYMLLLFFSC